MIAFLYRCGLFPGWEWISRENAEFLRVLEEKLEALVAFSVEVVVNVAGEVFTDGLGGDGEFLAPFFD